MRVKFLCLGVVAVLLNGAALADDAPSNIDASGLVTIHAGEAFEITFPDRSDLTHPQFSRALDHIDTTNIKGYKPDPNAPPPTGPALLSFELKKTDSGMAFMLRNDTGVALKYSAEMVIDTRDGERSLHTSMCPIFPGMMGFERWPHPIVMLKLSGFHKPDSADLNCD